MENEIITLLYDLCRLCLDKPGIHDIFETDLLVQDIFSYTGIFQISCDDNLPKSICTHCFYKIKAAKDLKEYAAKNDLYMRSLLSDMTNMAHEIARPKISFKHWDEVLGPSAENNEMKTKKCFMTNRKDIKKEIKLRSCSTQTAPLTDIPTPGLQNSRTSRQKISVRSLKDINSRRSSLVMVSPKKEIPDDIIKKPTNGSHSSSVKKSGDETNICDICRKTFQTAKKLYLHRRSHSKNLHCPLDACSKSFATKGDLQKHIRSHTGEKPYQCDFCDKRFTQKVNLKSHREVKHRAKMEYSNT